MKRSSTRLLMLAVLLGLVSLLFMPDRVSAIPAFARRYETACTTCHVVPPKLNAFGVAFKNNGYRIPEDDEKFIKQPDVPLGAPGWKKLWPKKGVWPGAISDRIPLSGAVEMVTDISPKDRVKVDFAFPEEIELLSGGTLGSSLSFFADLAFEFSDGATEVDLERGHLNIQPFDTHLVNLRIGRFETGATPFSRFTQKLTDKDFIVSDFRAVPDGFRFRARQQGFELWGARNGPGGVGGFQYSLGLVNGSGSSNDDNSQKDFYGSASYKFRGFGVTGGGKGMETLKTSENYIDNSIEVGAFGYVGRTGATAAEEVRYNRVGVKVNAYINRLNLFGAFVHGRDVVFAENRRVNSNAWFIEGDVVTFPWVVGTFRYDQAIGDQEFLHVKRFVPGVSIMVRANVVLSAEAPIVFGDKHSFLNGEAAHGGGAIRVAFFF
jgi:hypothetical protein